LTASESLAMTDGEKSIDAGGMKLKENIFVCLPTSFDIVFACAAEKIQKTILRLLGSGLFPSFL